MSNKAFPGVDNANHEFLGAGAIYFDYGLATEVRVGVSKGGSSFSDNAEFREREADGDYAPVKGARDLVKITPQLTLNHVKWDPAQLAKVYAGMVKDISTEAGKAILTRKLNLASHYLTNVAFVGANRAGQYMVIILENALGDGAISFDAEKDEEIVHSVQFTGHVDSDFDPDDATTYPYKIEMATGEVTFTVTESATPVEGVTVQIDLQVALTDSSGEATFTMVKGTGYRYTVSKTGYVTQTGTTDVDSDTEAVPITIVSE